MRKSRFSENQIVMTGFWPDRAISVCKSRVIFSDACCRSKQPIVRILIYPSMTVDNSP